jgi:hypothetical protein
MTEPLSPAARKVLKAAYRASNRRPDDPLNDARFIAADAIRALVEQTMPEPEFFNICAPMTPVVMRFDWEIRRLQLAIAAELEGVTTTTTTPQEAQ